MDKKWDQKRLEMQTEKVVVGRLEQPPPVEEQELPKPPILTLPREMIEMIFSQFEDIQTLFAASRTCRSFRLIAREIKDASFFHLLMEDVVRRIFEIEDRTLMFRLSSAVRPMRRADPWGSLLRMKKAIRDEVLPKISLKALASLEGRLPYPDYGVVQFIGLRNSLVHRWQSVLSSTNEESFTLKRSHPFTLFSFEALIDAIALTPSVAALNIRAEISYQMMKLLIDATLAGKLRLKAIALDPGGRLDRKTFYAFIALLAVQRKLAKVEIDGVHFDDYAFSLLARTLSSLGELTHLSLQLPQEVSDFQQFGEFLRTARNLKSLHLGKVTDEAFIACRPYLEQSVIASLSFRGGDLTSRAAKEICRLIEKNTKLKHLDLVKNWQICEEEVIRIVRAVRRRPDFSFAISDNLSLIH